MTWKDVVGTATWHPLSLPSFLTEPTSDHFSLMGPLNPAWSKATSTPHATVTGQEWTHDLLQATVMRGQLLKFCGKSLSSILRAAAPQMTVFCLLWGWWLCGWKAKKGCSHLALMREAASGWSQNTKHHMAAGMTEKQSQSCRIRHHDAGLWLCALQLWMTGHLLRGPHWDTDRAMSLMPEYVGHFCLLQGFSKTLLFTVNLQEGKSLSKNWQKLFFGKTFHGTGALQDTRWETLV